MKTSLIQITAFLGSILLIAGPALAQNRSPRSAMSQDTTKPLPEKLNKSLKELIEPTAEEEGLDLEIDGLIVDQTLTKSGREFYEIFYNGWQPPNDASNFTIHIKEIPWPGRVQLTRISVLIDENEVMSIPLQPRYDVVEQAAKYAIGRAYNFLMNYEQIQADLQSEDKKGTGIF